MSASKTFNLAIVVIATALMVTGGRSQASGVDESLLWSFGNGTDGTIPAAGLSNCGNGALCGMTQNGGTSPIGGGTAFKLTPPAISGGSWTESILWNFGFGADGAVPEDALLQGPKGVFYGTTALGGAFTDTGYAEGAGTVFQLSPPTVSGGAWTESILWNFYGVASDGRFPTAGLISARIYLTGPMC